MNPPNWTTIYAELDAWQQRLKGRHGSVEPLFVEIVVTRWLQSSRNLLFHSKPNSLEEKQLPPPRLVGRFGGFPLRIPAPPFAYFFLPGELFSPGLMVERTTMILFNMSNQKGAPSDTAMAVNSQPI